VSPLTKLFVVLLVLVSVILTAGVVTFVNKLDPIQKNLDTATAKAAAANALANERQNALDVLQTQLNEANAAAAATAQTLNNQVQTLRSQIEDRDAQVASNKQAIATLTSANASQSSALAASEDAKTKLQEQVVTLRKDADERLRQIADLNQRVTSLVAENSVLNREKRNLTEQVVDLQGRGDRMGKLIKDLGGTDAMIAGNVPVGTRMGAPAINGVIRTRRTIAGKEYATISIGSQDQVVKGMEFKILDKESGAFLGIMTVDVVDANEAMGQIVADPNNLAQIRAGNVVRTQI
jgi:predicted  nucleic acid-binding Zn-ribbon protein